MFIHVVRHGRLVTAAAVLGVDHTTVSRQISKLERTLGHRLFDRTPSGWTLTTAGHELVSHAELVDSAAAAAEGLTGSQAGALSGTVRIATPDAFGAFLLSPGLGPLRQQYPDLNIQIVTWTRNISLSMREFDLAVTLEEPTSRHVSYRRLTDYVLGLYATDEYLTASAPIASRADLLRHSFIWYVDDLLDITPLRLLDRELPESVGRVAVQVNSVAAHWQAALAGLGIALLPVYVAGADARLTRILDGTIEIRGTYWSVIPRELARLDRVRAVEQTLHSLVRERIRDLRPVERQHHH